jgi:general secretion pathway protein L
MRFSLTALSPSLLAAWQWWSAEIVALVPPRWRQALAGKRGKLVLALGEGGGELLRHTGTGAESLMRFDLDLDPVRQAAAVRDALAALPARLKRGGVTVLLPAAAALRTEISLPLAAETNLAEVVGFELDRRTPFRSSEVYRAERVLRRDAAAKRLAVELTVAPRGLVDEAVAMARGLGLAPDGVEVAGDPPSGNLLPLEARPLAGRLPRLAFGAFAAATAVLALVAVLLPLHQAHDKAAALADALAETRRLADESLKLQKAIDAEIQEGGFLEARKRQAPSVSEVLFTLTHLLPDDTYLSELEIANGEVRLTGYAASASTVLGLVDQSGHFANAAFRSPVVQDQRVQREEFNIAARLQPQSRP